MKLLVISRDCFSDTNANGKTLKALLNAFSPSELSQFYTSTDSPDFNFCNSYFRITDIQMLMSFLKKPKVIIESNSNSTTHNNSRTRSNKVWKLIQQLNYNYACRYLRERLWKLSPRWKPSLNKWLKEVQPMAILYMVGDSFFLDQLVERIALTFNIPIILFNVEAYRIINCNNRHGFDRIYNLISERSYNKLQKLSSLTIYNCYTIAKAYRKFYKIKDEVPVVAYNAYVFDIEKYQPINHKCNIVYFGNLGVGRISSIVDIADVLMQINKTLKIDVYGSAPENEIHYLLSHPQINYHGIVNQQQLSIIKQTADILLQVESFQPAIINKLKFAFSTKIAQYLCAGRAILSYAPPATAATIYLQSEDAAVVAIDKNSLYMKLSLLVNDASYRATYAKKALKIAHKNHDAVLTGEKIKYLINNLI